MSRQRESKLSTKILAELRLKGAFCWKNHGNEMMMAGLPDIAGCYRGKFFAMETKMPESRRDVSPVQSLRHDQIRAAGGQVWVVSSVKEALALLDAIA